MEEIFTISQIFYKYAQQHIALDNISFSVKKGEIFSIIGSNGSGKSTLLHILNGLVFVDKGKVLYKDQLITEENLKNFKLNSSFRQSVGYVFQNSDSQLFCPTVFDELLFGPLQIGLPQNEAVVRAEEIMELLNISNFKDRPSYMLSGGEKKKVAIAAVLTLNPEVLLMDEPMSGLDPKSRSAIIELILDLNESGKTIIITTHHLELVDHLQSRVGVLSEKHQLEKVGTAEEILNDVDLLVKMNLLQEPVHRHGKVRHQHLPTGIFFHRHKH